MKWELRAFPDDHYAMIYEIKVDPSPDRSKVRVIAELRNEGSAADVLERGRLMASAPELREIVGLAIVVSQQSWGTSVSEMEHFKRMGTMDRLRAAIADAVPSGGWDTK